MLLNVKTLSRVEEHHLLEFFAYTSIASSFFHAVHGMIP
jgi:hypothetical protein